MLNLLTLKSKNYTSRVDNAHDIDVVTTDILQKLDPDTDPCHEEKTLNTALTKNPIIRPTISICLMSYERQ